LMEAIPDVSKSDLDFESKLEQFNDTFSFIRQQRIKRSQGLMAGAEQLYSPPVTGNKPSKAATQSSGSDKPKQTAKPKTWAELKAAKFGGQK
jgi:hypothetical protein